jgi:hypothetical protein
MASALQRFDRLPDCHYRKSLHAERIVVLLGDEAVADHPRHFRRDQIIYDPWIGVGLIKFPFP